MKKLTINHNIENNIASDIRLSRNVWSTRYLADHDVSCAAATLRRVIKYIVRKRLLYVGRKWFLQSSTQICNFNFQFKMLT